MLRALDGCKVPDASLTTDVLSRLVSREDSGVQGKAGLEASSWRWC